MGLDECSYARHMGAIKMLMQSLPPGWRPSVRASNECDARVGDHGRSSLPSPRRPASTAIKPLV